MPTSLALPLLRSPVLPARRSHGAARKPLTQAALQSQAKAAPATQSTQPARLPLLQRLPAAALAAVAAAALALGSPAPALAELQTVPATEAGRLAKPLEKQKVDKGRIWLLMVVSGAALFGSTVVLENNESWFPAISKANKAMTAAKTKQEDQGSAAAEDDDVIDVAAQEAEKQRLALIEVERELDRRAQEAVLAGLQQAKQQVLGAEEEEAAATAAAVAAAVLAPAAEAAPAAAAPTAEPPAQQEQQQHDSSGGAAVAAEAASEPAAAAADKAEKKAEGEAENEVEDAEARAAAEDAAKYPPLIFEPGSLDKIGSDAPPVLQGMSDEQLEAALRRRQEEMAALQSMSDEQLEAALRQRQQQQQQ